jgi:hypothetical protein
MPSLKYSYSPTRDEHSIMNNIAIVDSDMQHEVHQQQQPYSPGQQLVDVMNETLSNDFSKEELSTDEDEEDDTEHGGKDDSARPTIMTRRGGLSRRASSKLDFGVKPCSGYFSLSLASNMCFVVASCFYLALAARELDYSIITQDLSDDVLLADDDYTWQMEAPFVGDDYMFATNGGAVLVSHYQMLYFAGALCFVCSGLLDCIKEPGWLGVVLILAGAFGLASAMLVEKNVYQSAVLNSVSVHLFLLEALGLFFERGANGAIFANNPTLQRYVRLGDMFWILGTFIDVVLSYYYVFETDGLVHAQMAVFAATLWLACSLIYITATSHVECQGRKLYNLQHPRQEAQPSGNNTNNNNRKQLRSSTTHTSGGGVSGEDSNQYMYNDKA